MTINLSYDSKIPLYIQIKNQIIINIINKKLKIGDHLPSLRLMSKRLQVNVQTILKAYNLLQSKNLIANINKKWIVIESNSEIIKDSLYESLYESINLYLYELKILNLTENEFIELCRKVYKKNIY